MDIEPRGSAERMRLSRERKRNGLRCFTLEIRDQEIVALIDQGFLLVDDREDAAAVVEALYRFLDLSLA
jgi:hypothetical protein